MQLTLVEMVQNILNAMDSDAVNSIDDTIESQQVAEIVRETYFDLIAQRDWPWLREEFALTGLGDVDNPTTMRLPSAYSTLLYVRYNKKEVSFVSPEEFRAMVDLRVEQTGVVDSKGFILNRDPQYFTSYDDDNLVFDAIDMSADNTLIGAKSVCYGARIPSFTMEDTFVPDVPEKMFPTLLADAKATCFLNLKQQPNAREERRAQRGRVIMQNNAWRNNYAQATYNGRVNYGRN